MLKQPQIKSGAKGFKKHDNVPLTRCSCADFSHKGRGERTAKNESFIIMNIFLIFYRFLSYLAWPIVQLYLSRRVSRGKEIPTRLSERYGFSSQTRPKGKLIWFHVASLGEGLSTLSLISKIAAKRNTHVLVTYGTVTASKILPQRLPKKVLHCFVPVDLSFWVRRFLVHWQPDKGIFVESELWPGLLLESKEANIPLILINGRMSARSFSRWSHLRPLAKALLSAFNVGLMQDEEMARRYQVLGLEHVEVLGNIKLAADPLPVDKTLLKVLKTSVGKRHIWVAASMHVYEEDFILSAHEKLKSDFPDLLTILVPRKLEHVEALCAKLRHKSLKYVRHERGDTLGDHEVYLVDVMGQMGTFLELAEVVYVGGSQIKTDGKPLGGHNPLEPALLGKAICFGPDMSNAQKVAQDLISLGAAEIVDTSQKLAECLSDLFQNAKLRKDKGKRALEYAKSEKEIILKALTFIETDLPVKRAKPERQVLHCQRKLFSLSRPSFWETDSVASKALWLPSFAYSHVSKLYQSNKNLRQIDIPVICVGNLIAGGAGKTPTIIAIAEYLMSKGASPHIISRGYGRKRKDTLLVDETRTVADVGDEPLLLTKTCPTWVGDRYHAMKKAVAAGATHLLLDDGFQDASIHKDFSLLVFDGHYGVGNGKVLPAGPLREPLAAGVERADATLIIGEDHTRLTDQIGASLTAKFVPLTTLPEKKFVAFAGIGNPSKFFKTLEDAGVILADKVALPDHATYTEDVIRQLEERARMANAELVTTEKDAVKLKELSIPLHVFKVKLEISGLSCLKYLIEDKVHAAL